MTATVIQAGFLASVQDQGRTGYRAFGVSTAGALDPHALRVANLLVGNDESAAGLEITFGGLQLRFTDERAIAWCGGRFDVKLGTISLPAGHLALTQPGDEIRFGRARAGCRCWLAISGGINVPVVLESRSTDLRGNFGGLDGRTLRDGDELELASLRSLPHGATRVSSWSAPHEWSSPANSAPTLRFFPGAHWDQFDSATRQSFVSEPFAVLPDSDRMGVRLDGATIERISSDDLISEGVAPGTIQVPPNGKPILLLNDCQTIGGYPKIAHVISLDLGVAAQLRTGDQVRFSEVSMADAHRLWLKREHELELFRVGLSFHDS